MAVLAIVTSSPPGVEGGHLVIARALLTAAREQGHDAHLVITPDHGFGRTAASYRSNWFTDVKAIDGQRVDQVVSLRYASYAVRHPAHVCWLNHTMREYYDLWPRFSSSISPRARVKERVRQVFIHAADWWLLTQNVTDLVAQSSTVQRRLREHLGVRADVLHPPPPPRGYRCERYGDYIFAMSRLTPLKRLDLLIRALGQPPAGRLRAVIAGEGESRTDLQLLAESLGVAQRVTFLGRIDDETMVDHLARCRAVWFAPFNEDYGLVTVEAFAASKAVITCRDSGGPAELVRHDVSGFVCEPTPESGAAALARLGEDAPLAERLGRAAGAQAASMTWSGVVKRLVIV